mgnify:CR=1 FL=1
MKNVVIYARYSSDNQREESIESQIRICSEYIHNNNLICVGHYIDRAFTGTNDKRPDFQKMIDDSSKGLFDTVLILKLDRFSRNTEETIKLISDRIDAEILNCIQQNNRQTQEKRRDYLKKTAHRGAKDRENTHFILKQLTGLDSRLYRTLRSGGLLVSQY